MAWFQLQKKETSLAKPIAWSVKRMETNVILNRNYSGKSGIRFIDGSDIQLFILVFGAGACLVY